MRARMLGSVGLLEEALRGLGPSLIGACFFLGGREGEGGGERVDNIHHQLVKPTPSSSPSTSTHTAAEHAVGKVPQSSCRHRCIDV